MLRLTTAEAQQDHIFLEIPTLVRRLVFCNDPTSVRICYCDGPQYIYQDRYGSPLSPFGLERCVFVVNLVRLHYVVLLSYARAFR